MDTQQARHRTSPEKEEDTPRTGPDASELAERRREAQGCLQALSQHSYWFDLWIFLLFDLVLFIFVYLLP